MKTIFTIILLGLGYFTILAQIEESIAPKSFELNQKTTAPVMHLPVPDLQSVWAEEETNIPPKNKMYRFAVKIPSNYNLANSGQWAQVEGGRIWTATFACEGALTLHFELQDFELPKGANLHFYNSDKTDVQGAYTSKNNNYAKILSSWVVQGDEVTVEYFEPHMVKNQGTFTIAGIYYGYKALGKSNLKALNSSGHCNVDVDCGVGEDWEAQKDINKKSVAMLIIGGGLCSGALINNTANDGTPYLLTANHCLSSNSSAASTTARFGWISPNPDCATTAPSTNGPTTMQLNGSSLRATSSSSDFTLIEFNSTVPAAWERVFAGWDRSGQIPSYVVGIHHPSGDIMKICRDNSGVQAASYAGKSVWNITSQGGGWEIGVTEGGSSGSPLFDNQGRIIGQLFAGGAACSGTVDNGQFDVYGKFDVSWAGNGTNSTRLSNWLDPNASNVTTLNSYDPSTMDTEDIPAEEELITISPNPSTGIFTIHTSNSELRSYQVFSSNGQLILEGKIQNTTESIDLSQFDKGIYFIQIKNGNSYQLIKK